MKRIDDQSRVMAGVEHAVCGAPLAGPGTHFLKQVSRDGAIIQISYETAGNGDWKLTVSDNGTGKAASDTPKGGLGTAIVEALIKQLDARMDTATGPGGTTISITRATFTSKLPQAV